MEFLLRVLIGFGPMFVAGFLRWPVRCLIPTRHSPSFRLGDPTNIILNLVLIGLCAWVTPWTIHVLGLTLNEGSFYGILTANALGAASAGMFVQSFVWKIEPRK